MIPRLRHAVVLGAGTMGAQLACLLAGAGADVSLLDVDEDLARAGLERSRNLRPSPLYEARDAERIATGGFVQRETPGRGPAWGIEGGGETEGGGRAALCGPRAAPQPRGVGGRPPARHAVPARVAPGGGSPLPSPASAAQGVADEQGIHPERTTDGLDPAGRRCPPPSDPAGSGPACTTTYSEGLFVGYRWYDEQHLSPMFPFGYGLSYTTFAYSGLRWSRPLGGGLAVTFRVTNTGRVAGDEVPQVYLGAPASPPRGVAFAARALAACTRISLRPGESQLVTLQVPLRQLQYWDAARGWVTATGPRPLDVGADERTDDLATTVSVVG